MAHKLERSLSSLTAIAAATLLLSTTPALAQSQPADAQPPAATAAPTPDAQPAPQTAPDMTPAPPAQNAPALATTPDTAPAAPPAPTMTTDPVVQPVPDSAPAQANAAPTAPTAPRAAPQPRAVTHATARTTPAPAATGGIPAATPVQKPAPAAQTPANDAPSSGLTRRDPAGLYTADGTAVAASSTQTVTHQSPYARYWPLEAAGGIVLIGLIGYAFTRRREEEDEEVYTVTTVEEPVADIPAMPVTATAASIPAQPLTQAHSATLDLEEAPEASILPAGPVPSGAEREALLQRMVEAQPDAANPFHTVKARLRRARMILAARKQALRERATEAFDWRTYKPSLRHATLGGEVKPATTVKRETVK